MATERTLKKNDGNRGWSKRKRQAQTDGGDERAGTWICEVQLTECYNEWSQILLRGGEGDQISRHGLQSPQHGHGHDGSHLLRRGRLHVTLNTCDAFFVERDHGRRTAYISWTACSYSGSSPSTVGSFGQGAANFFAGGLHIGRQRAAYVSAISMIPFSFPCMRSTVYSGFHIHIVCQMGKFVVDWVRSSPCLISRRSHTC